MSRMPEMHDTMVRAGTPQERQTLMAEQMKLMQEGMAMMGAMGHGGIGLAGAASAPMDMAARQQMMEERMEMMQMMTERMSPPAAWR
ncbi:MAG: hypothetical protein MUF16_00775 [Burkholderiaceae bacterium]|nr:hypothetical protein [Burkholderiaceae bacterium]